jgi:hypothetical protein
MGQMSAKRAVVVTTINSPTFAVEEIARRCTETDSDFYIIGDSKSPSTFHQEGAKWFDLQAQRQTGFRFAELCPVRHYARKNIGYLAAIRDGVDVIVETDDDNIPQDGFLDARERRSTAATVTEQGWCNVYRHFSDANIWPRGLPLDRIQDTPQPYEALGVAEADCPIHQGLADRNPDVDAVYRLVLPLPIDFVTGREVILSSGAWCPFNSQNTTWWRDAFPLLYLPFHCSFRMTDIWRSFVAQRLAWECGWNVLFHGSTVYQERNEHDLMRDFADEVPGYLHNERIRKTLEDLPLASGVAGLSDNLTAAYAALVKLEVVGADEQPLLAAWLDDLAAM